MTTWNPSRTMGRDEILYAVRLLKALLYDGSNVAFTGRSLSLILNRLGHHLEEAPGGGELELLERWERYLPTFREHLLAAASLVPRPGREGEVMPLVTEDAAVEAIRKSKLDSEFP